MSQQHPHAYDLRSIPARQHSAHRTSNIFSSSAQTDEDWTKVSNLTERRKIQNRIAQRNYRQKLKRRLEDLERRAASSNKAESKKIKSPSPGKNNKREAAVKAKIVQQAPGPASTPMKATLKSKFIAALEDNKELILGALDDRERSDTLPVFTNASYPAPHELLLDPYGSVKPYPAMPATDSHPNHPTATIALDLPSLMHFDEAWRDMQSGEQALNPYPKGFADAIDIGVSNSYHAHMLLSHSYEHSTSISESFCGYPATPLSMASSGTHSQQ